MATSSIDKKLGHISFKNSVSLPDEIIDGGFSKDGTIVWSWTPEKLLFYHVTPPTSSKSLKPFAQILMNGHQLESHTSLLYNNKELLILTLSDQGGSILLAISLTCGKLVRVIKLPFTVSTVTGLSHVTFPGLFTHSPLSSFTGGVACGCGQTGRVFLLDLALGHSAHWPRPFIDYPRSVNVFNYNKEGVVLEITSSINDRIHPMLCINSGYYVNRNKVYQYCDSKNKLIGSFEGVSVTALHHFPLVCGLLVGYNFGGFQLYSLTDSTLLYSLPVIPRRLLPPVIKFGVQEPEDDPRHFLYVWAVRKGPEQIQEIFGSSPTVTMYQMSFKKKLEHLDNTFYTEIEGCNRRFEYMLWPWHDTSGVVVSTMTLDQNLNTKSQNMNSTFIAFTCRGVEEPHTITVTLFDLNSWYNSQMPLHPTWNPTNSTGRDVCPYLAVYQVSCDSECVILDGMSHSLSHFMCPSSLTDVHSSVESVSSSINVLTTKDIITANLDGLQSQVVNEILTRSANIMSNPAHYISLLQSANLLPEGVVMGVASMSIEEMNSLLLTACLRLDLGSVLVGVVNASLVTSYHVKPLTVVEWIRKELQEIIDEKYELVDQLLYTQCSSDDIDTSSLRHIIRIYSDLSILSQLITILIQSNDIISSQEDLSMMYCTADVHIKTIAALQWCIEMKLLPHNTENGEEEKEEEMEKEGFVFPSITLTKRYQDLMEESNSLGLAVDVLVNDVTLPVEGVVFHYPPTDMSCIPRLCAYRTSLSQQLLILYILLDISTPHGDPTLAYSFAMLFYEDTSLVQLIQFIWNIDHGNVLPLCTDKRLLQFPAIFKLAVNRLLEEGNIDKAIEYVTLFGQKEPSLAIKVFIESGHVTRALKILEDGQGSEDYPILLEQFVHSCLTSPYCSQVTKLQLKDDQLDDICGVLNDVDTVRSIHIALSLLIHHLKNYDAVKLARTHREKGIMLAEILADSSLLHPLLENISSSELLQNIHQTRGVPVCTPRRPFSSMMIESSQNQFTSNADILLMAQITETQNNVKQSSVAMTPFKRTPARKVLSSLPFVSSPHITTPVLLEKKTPSVATPSRQKSMQNKFVEQMESFKMRMAVLNAMNERDIPLLRTPKPTGTPSLAPPTSILKPKTTTITSTTADDIDSTPTVLTGNRRIRFALEESEGDVVSPPTEDNSGSFFSLEGSPQLGGTEEVCTVDGDGSLLSIHSKRKGKEKKEDDGSFIAEEEEEDLEDETIPSSQLQTALIRSPLSSFKKSSRFKTTPLSHQSMTPLNLRSPRVDVKRTSLSKSTTPSKKSNTPIHSSIMVPMLHPPEDYHFSPPNMVAPPPSDHVTQEETNETTLKSDFVFSPPLLRSASRERKAKELSEFGRGLTRDTPTSRVTHGTPSLSQSKTKPLRSIRGRRRK